MFATNRCLDANVFGIGATRLRTAAGRLTPRRYGAEETQPTMNTEPFAELVDDPAAEWSLDEEIARALATVG
jgi:hypothetical protein